MIFLKITKFNNKNMKFSHVKRILFGNPYSCYLFSIGQSVNGISGKKVSVEDLNDALKDETDSEAETGRK